jgi:hypothetical protein
MDYKYTEPDGSLLVSVRCLGLGISSKSPLPTAGLFSNLYVSWSKNPNVKNEKKYVRIEQSDHYPSSSLNAATKQQLSQTIKYKTIYTSELFEDTVDVFPSLLAKVKTSDGLDSRLKLSVYYSSSLTSGKEIVLAYCSFSEKELISTVLNSSVFIISLESEYCIASKAYIDIIQPFPSLIESSFFSIVSSNTEKNPLNQNYVFYNEMDSITPFLDSKETAYEPKFVANIPLIFLTNLQASIERSIENWEKRLTLERMRQGRFLNDQEALEAGWHIIDINIKGARIGSTKSTIDRINYMRNQNNPSSASSSVPSGTSSTMSASSSAPSASSPDEMIYLSYYPLSDDYLDPASAASSAPGAVVTPASPQRQASGLLPQRRTQNSGYKGFLSSSSSSATGNDRKQKVDDSLPSTFVDIFIEDLSQTYLDSVGRTNTEYYNMYPVYGSNLHASQIGKKANTLASASADVVTIAHEENEFKFQTFSSNNKSFIPKRWRFNNTHYSEGTFPVEFSFFCFFSSSLLLSLLLPFLSQ